MWVGMIPVYVIFGILAILAVKAFIQRFMSDPSFRALSLLVLVLIIVTNIIAWSVWSYYGI